MTTGGGHSKKVLRGILWGGLFSVAIVAWIFHEENPEEDRHPAALEDVNTLGFQIENLSSVSLKPLSVEEIAKKLGFEDGKKALKAAAVLADRVKFGVLTKNWQEECPTQNSPLVCEAIEDYFAPKLLPALPSNSPNSGHRLRRFKSVSFSIKNIPLLQSESVNEQVRRIPDMSWRQIKNYAEISLRSKECPRNFSISLARQVEEHLKEPEAWSWMDKLDTHGLECVKGDEVWAELVLQRVAYLKMGRKLYAEAIPLLDRALQATSRKEDSRSLYWLGFARKNLGLKKEAQAAFGALWKSFPLAWPSIMSQVQEGRDPLQEIRSRIIYSDDYSSGDAALDKRSLWLQLMTSLDEAPFVVRHYGEFVVKSFGPTLKAGFVQHLARIFNNLGLYRLQIMALSNIAYSRPDTVTIETLRLLYPRPYFEELQQKENKLDLSILLGLARQESGFDPSATSKANARGLMQLLPSTARTLRRGHSKKLYDSDDNIALGSQFLMKLIKYFDGSVEKTLAAYNAGQTIVNKWSGRYDFTQDTQLFLDLIPYKETRDYVPSILRNAYWYHRLFPEMTQALLTNIKTSDLLRLQLFPKSERNPSGSPSK